MVHYFSSSFNYQNYAAPEILRFNEFLGTCDYAKNIQACIRQHHIISLIKTTHMVAFEII